MNTEICNVIDKLAENFGIAVDWGNENVVPYIQDLVARYSKYEIVSNAISWMICIVLAGVCIIGIIRSVKNIKREAICDKDVYETEDWEYVHIIIIVMSILVLIGCTILACCFADNLIRWIFVPDVSFVKMVLSMIQ